MGQSAACLYESVHRVNENWWHKIVGQSERGTVFHSHDWLRTLEGGLAIGPRHAIIVRTTPDFTKGLFRYKRELGETPEPNVSRETGTDPVQWPRFRFGRSFCSVGNAGEVILE